MAKKVSNLKIAVQVGTTDTLFASWSFNTTSTTTSSSIKAGDKVTIKSGSKYYNGVDIPDWVESLTWIVKSVKGDRAVISKATTGNYNINSPINTKYLNKSGSSSSSTTTVSNLDYYEVKWFYATGSGVWFSGGESQVKGVSNAVYSPPSHATKAKVSVKPVSKTYQSGNKTKSYWTGTAVTAEYLISENPPTKMSAPSVSVKDFTLTTVVENITDSRADKIEFELYRDEVGQNGETKSTKVASGTTAVLTARASYAFTLTAGYKYRVRCRAINAVDDVTTKGEWSDFSTQVSTIPGAVTNVKVSADSKTSVKVTWTGTDTAESYTVEYSTKQEYFDSSTQVSSTTVENTTAYISGLDSGDEWFFRVRASNNDGDSGWSEIVSTVIGTKPEAPTTWSSSTTAIVGENVTLYWVHNSKDGSKQRFAQIQLIVDGDSQLIDIDTSKDAEDEEEPEKIHKTTLDLADYVEGASLLWKVRTKGIYDEYGEWSIQRTIKLYAPPTLSLSLGTTDGYLDSYPINVTAAASPVTQTPVSYYISVTAEESHEITSATGEPIRINAGAEVYSQIFNTSDNPLSIEMSAGGVALENGQTYRVTVTVAMDSGLTAEASDIFIVNWSDNAYDPDARLTVDYDTLCVYISPFTVDEEGVLYDNLTHSVYRREYDGTFTELATGLVNDGVISITDPHPALDFARYRIVAREVETDILSFTDLPGEPINEPSIVIQWDEAWTNFDYDEEAPVEIPPWTGSMVKLPYNVDVGEQNSMDVSLVEYIGRKRPVSYYGTQLGEGATWSTEIPKTDKETVYALRRLSKWTGDVYVREPSGVGYWAQISVSMSTKHRELTIPISFAIKRVEGGV